jgi:hypothetical protein
MTIVAASLPKSASSSEMAHIINNSKKLNVQEAVALARQIRLDLGPKTKDRKWRLKTYNSCFKASHVLQWAMEHVSSDEYVSVYTLNQLIAYGLLVHVVDPTKKIRVGETRTLYFRIASAEVLDREYNLSTLIASGKDGISSEDFATIQKQVIDIEHTLQRTVKQLNYTQGKMDVIHQEVLGLISQQISTFVMIFINLICVLVHSSHNNNKSGYISATALAITMIVSTHYGWRCINLWSTLDLDDRGMMPIETVVVDYEDGSESNDLYTPLVENSNTRRRSIAAVIQNSFKFARLNSLRRGSSSMNDNTPTTIVKARDEYSLPNVNEWEHRPLLICANTVAIPTMITDTRNSNNGYLPLGIPFNFSSDLFEGLCLIRVKGANSDAIEENAKYFSGRKRIFQSIVQGRFKEEVNVSDCMTGHEFTRPLKNLPHPIILKTATNLLGRFQPGATICVHTDQPYISATLLETTQIFRGDQPGNEPNIASHNIQEDSSILGGVFATDTIPASRRKRIFSNPSTCPKCSFDTETVYTFEFYQNSFDAQSYSLDLGFTKLALSKVFDHQPIQWLGKMKDGRYLWSFQIWNESLLSKK